MTFSAPEKRLIVAVEGTAALGPYWKTILNDYLEKIVRSFFGSDSTGQKQSAPSVGFALIVFYVHGRHCSSQLQRGGWIRDPDAFLERLSSIGFIGGGFEDAKIAEALGEALLMLNPTQQNVDGKRHCIIIAARNPYPLPTRVYSVQGQSDGAETQACIQLCDAESVAKSFAQCSISLSVICPKQLPKLKAIYRAAKRNPQSADVLVDTTKNPYFLFLIPENFMEARTAFSHSGIANLSSTQSPVKLDATSVLSVSGPPVSVPPGSVMSRQPVSVGNIPSAIVKIEPTTAGPIPGHTFPNIPSVPRSVSQTVPSLQTSSPISVPQDLIPNNENISEIKPIVSGLAPLRPVGGAAANVKILNDVAQARQALAAGTSMGLQPMGGTPMLSKISNGMMTSGQSGVVSVVGSVSLTGNVPVAQNTAPTSFPSTASQVSGTSNISISQPLSNIQGGVTMGQTVTSMSTSNLTGTQMGQTGIAMNQNMTIPPSGAGTMIPTPGMSPQNQGMQSLVVNNSSATNMPLSQQPSSTMPSAQSKYIKVWEGSLSGQRQGQPVFITRLEGYRSASASETLAANWPPTMQIVRLISQDHMNNKQYVGKADFLVFRAMNQHGFLGQLQEKKLCAVIQLPSQTLLLSVSDKACRLIGMLFPGDMVVFKPQIPNQQQLQAQHSQIQPQQLQHLQPTQSLPQLQQQQQQQHLQQMQQQPLLPLQQQQQMQQIQLQQQQMPPLQQQQQQQQPQQMVGTGMGQPYMQGSGRSQLVSQGQVSSQGPPTMPGGGFIN